MGYEQAAAVVDVADLKRAVVEREDGEWIVA